MQILIPYMKPTVEGAQLETTLQVILMQSNVWKWLIWQKQKTIQYNCLDGLLVSNQEIMNVGTGVFWSDVIFNTIFNVIFNTVY